MTRLTNKWTKTAEEAFGASGKKGREGEIFLIKVLKSWGWSVKDHEDDREKQVAGIDITFKSPNWHNWYTGDSKCNMKDNSVFYVYRDWLFSTKADRIFHVNPKTGWVAYYGVDEMRKIYDTNKLNMTFGCKNSPAFVKRKKYASESK